MLWNQRPADAANHHAFGCHLEEGRNAIPFPKEHLDPDRQRVCAPRNGLAFELCQLQLLR
jgi:hypothetical protein